MKTKASLKTDLRVVRKMLQYYKVDHERHNANWDDHFKQYVEKRIEALKEDEAVLLKELGYA